jgi:hypothetical protein
LIRKFIAISAAALAIGALSVSPLVANASPNVNSATSVITATVDTTAQISTSDVNINWNRGLTTTGTLPVNVLTNDTAGYTFTFVSAVSPSTGSNFELQGLHNGNQVVYTIWGANGDQYWSNVAGGYTYGANNSFSTPSVVTSYFTITLPQNNNAVADTYQDKLTIEVNTL